MTQGGADPQIVPMPDPGTKKRPRPASPTKKSVAEYLQSFKRRKAEKESRSWDWAESVLQNETDLTVGQRIFVRYEVQRIEQVEEDTPEGESSETAGGPTAHIVNSTAIWWPAVIARYGERCRTLKEAWEDVKGTVAEEAIDEECLIELDALSAERPDVPVWELQYEAYDQFEAETLPVVFLSRSRLVHVTLDQLHIGKYRTEGDSGQSSDEEGDDSVDLREMWTILDAAVEEEAAAAADQVPAELVQRAAEASGRLRTILRRVMTELTERKVPVVTGDVLRSLFAEHARILDAELDGSGPSLAPVGGGTTGEVAAGEERDENLTEAPFPRPPSDKGETAGAAIWEEEEGDDD